MIDDLTRTLGAILDDPALKPDLKELFDAAAEFGRPSEDFKPNVSTVDLFLYDVRENVELRSNEPVRERKNGQVITHRPPLRVACSYLVTAWPKGTGEDALLSEHQLLGQALRVFSRYATIPRGFLKGKLANQESPLPMMTTHLESMKNPAEFWTAIGNKMRASFSVTVTFSMEVFEPIAEFQVITGSYALGLRTSPEEQKILPATRDETFRLGGRVTDAAGNPVEGALVVFIETGDTAATDKEGLFRMKGFFPAGDYQLRATKDAATQEVRITVPAPKNKNYDVQLP